MTKYVVEESGEFRQGEEGVFNGEQRISLRVCFHTSFFGW